MGRYWQVARALVTGSAPLFEQHFDVTVRMREWEASNKTELAEHWVEIIYPDGTTRYILESERLGKSTEDRPPPADVVASFVIRQDAHQVHDWLKTTLPQLPLEADGPDLLRLQQVLDEPSPAVNAELLHSLGEGQSSAWGISWNARLPPLPSLRNLLEQSAAISRSTVPSWAMSALRSIYGIPSEAVSPVLRARRSFGGSPSRYGAEP